VRILGVAGALPLEQGVGVASVHSAVVDGRIADRRTELAITDLLHDLVATERWAA
jgi:hypothetical protein